uniref:Uncharacterized protein n=1 Tax=Molossus molossus TaxID=27622 RepID=A0A7J8FZ43_MOLMO|nr:hypothetical protein HJG59_008227 [Molossus molossus]
MTAVLRGQSRTEAVSAAGGRGQAQAPREEPRPDQSAAAGVGLVAAGLGARRSSSLRGSLRESALTLQPLCLLVCAPQAASIQCCQLVFNLFIYSLPANTQKGLRGALNCLVFHNNMNTTRSYLRHLF